MLPSIDDTPFGGAAGPAAVTVSERQILKGRYRHRLP
jgi:hypothetical protein